jgi:hypothetical protein
MLADNHNDDAEESYRKCDCGEIHRKFISLRRAEQNA